MILECSPGFFGWDCTDTCPETFYGRWCNKLCRRNETQICHSVCGCLQRLDLNCSYETSILFENIESSSLVEECPSTVEVLSTSTGLLYYSLRYSFFFFKFYLWLVSLNNYWFPLNNCRYILFLIQQPFQHMSHARVCHFMYLLHATPSPWLNLLVKSVNWLTETVITFIFLRNVNILYRTCPFPLRA